VPVPSPTPFSAVARRSDVTAAGDLGDGGRDVARQAGGEEEDHRGDHLRFTGTAQGHGGELRVAGVRRHGLRHRRAEEAGPGGMALMRMFLNATSLATAFVMPTMPAFAAE